MKKQISPGFQSEIPKRSTQRRDVASPVGSLQVDPCTW
jgi:hypothetical protein